MSTKKLLKYRTDPEIAFDPDNLEAFLKDKLGRSGVLPVYRLNKRSVDARKAKIVVNIEVELFEKASDLPKLSYKRPESIATNAKSVIIIGAGPAGMFAALKCLELGIKPIVLERGGDVRARRRDLANINKEHIVNPESNYCFGEGGAGTYSDGKLYTRSKKRGDIQRILELLVDHGAADDILVDAHPHIGTNKLPKVVQEMRETILSRGGEIHFNTRVDDFVIADGQMKGILTANQDLFEGIGVILCTGHSARDIYRKLKERDVYIESKPFALGVRIEHPQELIDNIQYHCDSRGAYLPAASYALTAQASVNKIDRGVFSFCMCPGGFIVPSATNEGEIVVNGMSPSRRDSKFANSGMVVAVELEDLKEYHNHGALAAMQFQSDIEKRAFEVAGKTQAAPAQRMTDFVKSKLSSTLPECSYQPGLVSTKLTDVLPDSISQRLKTGLKYFGKKMPGYMTDEAVMVGVESRTSSPVKIPRDKTSLEHEQIGRFYPCGEGAGYAGGIVSAAIDGGRCAEALILKYKDQKID